MGLFDISLIMAVVVLFCLWAFQGSVSVLLYYIAGYAVLDLVLLMVISMLEVRLTKSFTLKERFYMCISIIIAVVVSLYRFLPTHSIPFCIFFTGQLSRVLLNDYGIKPISDILSLIGVIYGLYELFVTP